MLSHGTKGQSNGYHRFGYYRRDRIRRLVGLYGCAVEGWEGGCACGVGPDLTACDYVALASRRNTGRILTDIAASEPLVIRPPRSAQLAIRRSRVGAPFASPSLQPAAFAALLRPRERKNGANSRTPAVFNHPRALPQGHCRFGPALPGGMVGRHRDLEILGASHVEARRRRSTGRCGTRSHSVSSTRPLAPRLRLDFRPAWVDSKTELLTEASALGGPPPG